MFLFGKQINITFITVIYHSKYDSISDRFFGNHRRHMYVAEVGSKDYPLLKSLEGQNKFLKIFIYLSIFIVSPIFL